jgi:imidazolonepropionase-like amidohydrolase
MTVMPGMIDSHVHVTASSADLRKPAFMTPSLLYARSVPILEGMLMRGFTTVRDCGGADHGLAEAVKEGTLKGPRIIHCGKALSQTGGHGDFRAAAENQLPFGSCRCCNFTIGRVCDGITACREAVRDEVRKGASHIKIMASGGVASPTDRLENLQFSEEELKAIVEEAKNAKIYCCAHAYTDEAVERAVRCGVGSIEHGNYAGNATLDLMKQKGVFLVPTLITYDRLKKDGVAGGMPQELVDKVGDLVERGQNTLKSATGKGVDVCYGSDLLGDMHKWQAHGIDLHLKAGVSNVDLLKSLVQHSAQDDISGSRLLEKCRYTAILSLWVCRSQGGPPGGERRRAREPEAVDGPGQHQGHHRERKNRQERARIQKGGIRAEAREAITLRTLRSNPMRE